MLPLKGPNPAPSKANGRTRHFIPLFGTAPPVCLRNKQENLGDKKSINPIILGFSGWHLLKEEQ